MAELSPLLEMVSAQKRGLARGVFSVCSAHPVVLQAAFEQAREDGSTVLVESTSNQVNQEGGYTGARPAEFVAFVSRLAREAGMPEDRVVLGGDHLGPNPWTALGVRLAMARAAEMVRDYVRAGYAKVHLDASMRCADDPLGPLADTVAAARTADLAAAAEAAAAERAPGVPLPVYVIGTEVPPPGGQAGEHEGPAVTRVADAERGLDLTREAFARRGLGRAWRRVLAQVVQPGVEFGDEVVYPYRRGAATGLRSFSESQEASRLRGALDGLPGGGRPSRPGRGPLRDPQGRPRADLRLPRGGLRAGGDRARAPRAAGARPALGAAPRARPGHDAATPGTGRPTTARETRRACACGASSASATAPATTGRSRRSRRRSDVSSPTSTRSACPGGW